MPKVPALVWVMGLCAIMAGCGGNGALETAPVQGQVTLDGDPLPYGTVSFQPKAGSPATGRIDKNGKFTLSTYGNGDGAIVGMHNVLITATAVDAGTAPAPNPDEEMVTPKSMIPEKYTSFFTSGLTAEVVAGETNTFSFELKN